MGFKLSIRVRPRFLSSKRDLSLSLYCTRCPNLTQQSRTRDRRFALKEGTSFSDVVSQLGVPSTGEHRITVPEPVTPKPILPLTRSSIEPFELERKSDNRKRRNSREPTRTPWKNSDQLTKGGDCASPVFRAAEEARTSAIRVEKVRDDFARDGTFLVRGERERETRRRVSETCDSRGFSRSKN